MDLERAGHLVELDVGDAVDVARLLYVGAVRPDRQTHQAVLHAELLDVTAFDLRRLQRFG